MISLLFDLDDTLYSRRDTFARAFEKTFLGEDAPVKLEKRKEAYDYTALFKAFRKYGYETYDDAMTGRITMDEMYTDRIQRTMALEGASLSVSEALAFQERYAWELDHLSLSPVVEQMLSFIRDSGCLFGIVTNGESAHQRRKYDALHLERFLPAKMYVPTGDLGVSKPDPRTLELAAKMWDLKPESTWYVGDSYSHDVQCAASIGWHTVWFRRSGADDAPEGKLPMEPDFTVYSEQEMFDTVRAIIEDDQRKVISDDKS